MSLMESFILQQFLLQYKRIPIYERRQGNQITLRLATLPQGPGLFYDPSVFQIVNSSFI